MFQSIQNFGETFQGYVLKRNILGLCFEKVLKKVRACVCACGSFLFFLNVFFKSSFQHFSIFRVFWIFSLQPIVLSANQLRRSNSPTSTGLCARRHSQGFLSRRCLLNGVLLQKQAKRWLFSGSGEVSCFFSYILVYFQSVFLMLGGYLQMWTVQDL